METGNKATTAAASGDWEQGYDCCCKWRLGTRLRLLLQVETGNKATTAAASGDWEQGYSCCKWRLGTRLQLLLQVETGNKATTAAAGWDGTHSVVGLLQFKAFGNS